jgi:arylsulfatase A-like enzyme
MKALLLLLLCGGVAAHASTQPNVILMMADDQGWGDTSYNGHPKLKTPHLDRLAASGLRMDRFYTAHFNCSPTRASVMTGRHPHRMGTFGPGSPIRAQETTIAQVLKAGGYATGHFGKWHLDGSNGDKDTKNGNGRAIAASNPLSPGKMGFDTWVSASNFFDLDPVLGRQGVPEKMHGDGSDIITREALQFITQQAQAKKPFLSVIWFGNPHVPHEALPADKAAYSALPESEQNYYGELTAIDRNVGLVQDKLQALGIAKDTIIWYCSDNGGAAGPLSTGDLRGKKGTLWEGGVRVPGILVWPAKIPQPQITAVPCSTLDIFPTVLEATGLKSPTASRPADGISLLPLLANPSTARSQAIPFWAAANKESSHASLIEWPYKLHTQANMSERKKGKKAQAENAVPVLLYDVSADPKETKDLSAEQPEKVRTMTAKLNDWKASVLNSLAGNDYSK